MGDRIYLDNNATSPLAPEVAEAMRAAEAAGFANPGSQHEAGRRARALLTAAREEILATLGAAVEGRQPDQLIFTSGGTEANNLVLLGQHRGPVADPPPELVISAIEHPSVEETARFLAGQGWIVHRLGVSRDGVARVAELPGLLNSRTRLVSLMLGNNETGVLQPVTEAAAICRAAGVPVHTDATQVVGKLPVRFGELGVDFLTFSAHKFHGPKGIGAVVRRSGAALWPSLFGGFQQEGLRPGTESVPLAVGMQAALAAWRAEADARREHLAALRDRFEAGLRAGIRTGLIVNGAAAPRLPHTSNVAFQGLDRQALLMALDLAGVACSTGSACASGSSEPSPVLRAMGLDEAVVGGALRFSFGAQNTLREVDESLERICRVANDLRRQKNP